MRRRAERAAGRGLFFLAAMIGLTAVIGLTGVIGSAGAQTADDLTNAPLPEAVRNALARPGARGEAEFGVGPAVLQEGPVDPARYRLGAGDELTVHYTGRTSVTNRLVVSPEGDVYLPDVGAVVVAGRTLAEGKQAIRAAAGKILLNVRVDVSLTRLRTFKVSVGGEVRMPGVYAATAVTHLNELLREAGGLTDSAAVRDIHVQPPAAGGAAPPAQHVDLLPFLLQGRMEGSNPFLSDGQSVFVPRRTRLVRVVGAVIYPGTYDLPDSGTTVSALLDLVGFEPNASVGSVAIAWPAFRSAPGFDRGTPGVGLDAIGKIRLEHGIQVLVPTRGGLDRADLVTIEGEVWYPGTYSIAGNDYSTRSISQVIAAAGGFTREAVPSRVRLVRPVNNAVSDLMPPLSEATSVELTATEKEALRMKGISNYRAVIVDLSGAAAAPAGDPPGDAAATPAAKVDGVGGGPLLVPGDHIVVPRAGSFVEVAGRVKHPGFYAHEPGAAASDYVEKAGGYAAHADRKHIRIAAGPGDNLRLASDAGPPEPGDRVWVPERTPRSLWQNSKDALLVLTQVATIFIVINQAGK